MSSKFYPNGAGGTVGDQLDTCKPLQTSGNIWYVSSAIGTDAAAPAGQNREKPLATIAQAVTNSAADDIIVCLQGHTESLAAGQSLAKSLTIIGEGTTAGKPGVSFLNNAPAATLFVISASNCELRNLYFPENTQTNAGVKVTVGGSSARIVGCYFEQGAKDTGEGIRVGADNLRVDNTTMISTGVLRSAQPLAAIRVISGAITGLEFTGLTVSAGTVGFSNYAAVDLSATVALTKFKALGLSLLLGADMELPATWTGWLNCQLATGGSRVNAP